GVDCPGACWAAPARRMRSSRGSFAHLRGGPFDRAQDAGMRAAAADIVVERYGDLASRRRRITVEQGLRRDQDAGNAIAALPGLLVEKGLLQRVRPLRRAEPLNRQNAPAGDRGQRLAAGFRGFAVDQHHAGAALLEAAAELAADEAEMVAQD